MHLIGTSYLLIAFGRKLRVQPKDRNSQYRIKTATVRYK